MKTVKTAMIEAAQFSPTGAIADRRTEATTCVTPGLAYLQQNCRIHLTNRRRFATDNGLYELCSNVRTLRVA